MAGSKLIIDADPGVGDAVAIALALSDPQLDVIAITCCGGWTSGEQSFRNLQTLLSLLDPPRWPRLGWSSAPAATIPETNGKQFLPPRDGPHILAECDVIDALPHAPVDSPKLLTELVREFPGEVTLLTLGPLTNVELAMERHSDFLPELKSLVCFGGAVLAGGNVTSTAEFNIFADPEAARTVLKSPVHKSLLPLETANQFGLTFDQYDALKVDEFSRLGQFLSKTLPYTLRENRNYLGREGALLPGVVALCAVSRPRLFEREPMRVDVEVSGELTRGMTVFDRRRPVGAADANVHVLTEVDTVGVRDYLTQLVRKADTV